MYPPGKTPQRFSPPAPGLYRFPYHSPEGRDILSDVTLFDVYQAEDVGEENKSLAFSLTFQSRSSTLKDSEVDAVVQTILNSLYKTHEAIQR